MAKPIVFTWPASDADAIALLQSPQAAGALVNLNGALANNGIVIFQGFSRYVTLTSTANLSAINFVITGILDGKTVTETLAGPNNNTVTGITLFDVVKSISVSATLGANTVSVGTSLLGFTHWFLYNYHATVVGFSAQVNVTGTIEYTFQTTLDDVQSNTAPMLSTPIVAMTGATTDQFANYNNVFRYGRIAILGTTDDTGSLVATFLQQGIT